MDFSSTQRAIQSLQRRKPPLSSKVITLANQLEITHSNPLDTQFVECTIELLKIGTFGESESDDNPAEKESVTESGKGLQSSQQDTNNNKRWEPLAVGLHLTASYLQNAALFYNRQVSNKNDDHPGSPNNIDKKERNNNVVYMDGPRVPSIAHSPHESKNDNDDGTSIAETNTLSHIDIEVDETQLLTFSRFIMTICQTHLEHNEPRVRSLVAKVVGEHTKLGTTLYSQAHSLGQTIIDRSIALYHTTNQSLKEHLASGRDTKNKSTSSDGALDDTTGWRALETNLFGLGSFVHAAGDLYFELIVPEVQKLETTQEEEKVGNTQNNAHIDETLLDNLEYCCITHVNRHVRAAALALLEQMVHACASSIHSTKDKDGSGDGGDHGVMKLLLSPDASLRRCIVKILKVTLSDNWSQVRMAASVLCRVFYVTLLDYAGFCPSIIPNADSWLTSTYPLLLPRMCLNRFYLAQGVKLYSHDTWRIIFERSEQFGCMGGIESVAMNAAPVCRYYVQMCDADNHVVREAACQAVAELATKLGRSVKYSDYLAPYVLMLLQALLMCFHDESWPVRDEACLACGTFCLAYPKECEPELPILFSRWTEQLTDQIWSVREDAAVALGDAIEAYGPKMFDQVMEVLRRDLPSARKQPPMSREEYRLRQNDVESHTNSQLYSCGSLAPKLRKSGAGRIGCSNCLINRPKAPWEATDGCIYLIRELCIRLCTNGPGTMQEGLALTDDILIPIMTELADICRVKHFPQSDELRTTLWKQLPIIAKSLGKQRFKRHYLQPFMDLLLMNMENRHDTLSKLSVHAAGQCAEMLSSLVGVGIFRGRMEDDWQRDLFDRVMEERRVQALAAGPGPEAFSPFGPHGGMVVRNNGTGAGIGGEGVSGAAVSDHSSPFVKKFDDMKMDDGNVDSFPQQSNQMAVPGNSQFESL